MATAFLCVRRAAGYRGRTPLRRNLLLLTSAGGAGKTLLLKKWQEPAFQAVRPPKPGALAVRPANTIKAHRVTAALIGASGNQPDSSGGMGIIPLKSTMPVDVSGLVAGSRCRRRAYQEEHAKREATGFGVAPDWQWPCRRGPS